MSDIVIDKAAQTAIVKYLQTIMATKRRFTSLITKLTAIDVGYACYKAQQQNTLPTELDIDNIIKHDEVNIPLIVSQVDSLRAYFIDVFLSGSPMFPVVSSADNAAVAEKFESVIEAFAAKGRYARQLALAFTHAAKYNLCAVEATWQSLPPFLPVQDKKLADYTNMHIVALRALDPYNLILDYRVPPANVPYDGEFAGDVQLVSRNYLKRLMNDLSREQEHMNVNAAFSSGTIETGDKGELVLRTASGEAAPGVTLTYTMHPQVSNFISSSFIRAGGTWEDWLNTGRFEKTVKGSIIPLSNMYELATIYARIIPSEFGIKRAPKRNTPQVWKFRLVNGQVLISAERVLTPHDVIPVYVAQPNEDGLMYQTQSVGEGQLPLQRAASDLYNVFLNSAKRAINDRMLYDPEMISPADINSPVPAAKIPVKSLRLGRRLEDAAKLLPFDSSGTANALSNMQQTIQLSYMLTGLNPFRQGMTQKGNRTLEEFNSIIQFSDLRTRVQALMLEMQLMVPIKEFLKFSILTHPDQIDIVSPYNGKRIRFTVDELAAADIEFKLADGFTPKSKLVSSDDLQIALTTIVSLPQLQQEYDIPKLFAHLMSLRGVRSIEQYKLQNPQGGAINDTERQSSS